MLGKNANQTNFHKLHSPLQSQPYHTPKNYLNYVSFQQSANIAQRDQARQPDHIAMYALNVHQHPQPRPPQVDTNSSINRNPYLNPSIQQRRQPPKQTLVRNSSNKQQIISRQSHELTRNKTQSLKNTSKNNSQSQNKDSAQPIKSGSKSPLLRGPQNVNEFGSPAWSKTVDLGQMSRNRVNQNSVYPSPEEDQIKQKLNYLEVIEQAISQFQLTKSPHDLQQLNTDNRILMIRAYEEIKRFKEEKSRRSINDSASLSENLSEDGLSIQGSRNNSLRLMNDKKGFLEGFTRSKQKDRAIEAELQKQMNLNQKLKQEYQDQLAKSRKKGSSQLEKLNQAIALQQVQISKLSTLNSEVASKLSRLPFYQQWKIMCQELQGAKKISLKLKAELKSRAQKLKVLQAGGDYKQSYKNEQKQYVFQQQDCKNRDGSLAKNKVLQTNNLKIPPSPVNRAPGIPTSNANSNRVETSMRFGTQNRPRSVNRVANN